MMVLGYWHHGGGGGGLVTFVLHYLAARSIFSGLRIAGLPIVAIGCVAGAFLLVRALTRRRRVGGDRAWYRGTYLRSAHWRRFRLGALRRAGNRCSRCGARGPLDVHHRTYSRLGHERARDVAVLCRSCHDREHGR